MKWEARRSPRKNRIARALIVEILIQKCYSVSSSDSVASR